MICEKQTRLVLPAFNFPNRIFKPHFLLRRDCMSQNSVQAHVKDSIFLLAGGKLAIFPTSLVCIKADYI